MDFFLVIAYLFEKGLIKLPVAFAHLGPIPVPGIIHLGLLLYLPSGITKVSLIGHETLIATSRVIFQMLPFVLT